MTGNIFVLDSFDKSLLAQRKLVNNFASFLNDPRYL